MEPSERLHEALREISALSAEVAQLEVDKVNLTTSLLALQLESTQSKWLVRDLSSKNAGLSDNILLTRFQRS